MRVFLASLALLAGSVPALAQPVKTPEQMLSADCLVFFRYDGYEPHRQAYEQTALAKVMKEGLAEFFDHLFGQLSSLTDGDLPGNLKKERKARPEAAGFLDCLMKHGFAFTLEVAPPGRVRANADDLVQATVVFPEGAEKKNRKALEDFFRMVAGALSVPIEETNHGGRPGRSVALGEMQAVWWPEGKHLLLTVGVQPVRRSLAVIEGRRRNLTAAPWYKELATFNRYETDMRGHVDLEAVVDYLAVVGLEAPGLANLKDHLARQILLRHLGLTGLKDLTFHLGFDGKYQRSTVRLGVVEPERRTGLLDLISGPIAYGPDKLPPLPPDADYVSIRRLDWENVYDYVRTTYGLVIVSRLLEGELPARFPDLDRQLGIDFRKDFLEQLDTTVVTYGAHSEGPFFLGQGFAVKVKDAAKVRKSLAAIRKALGETHEMLVADKKIFRGQEMYVFSKLYLPVTYTLHDDWLVFGLFPQPVQGFLLRSGGKYRVWKAPPEYAEALAKERKENGKGKLLALSVSDPRPVVEMGLALLPVWIQTMNQGANAQIVDISKIPNAQAVNEWLFPNIMFCYDDGNAIRWENYYSINEPDDLLLSMTFSTYGVPLLGVLPLNRWLPKPQRGEAIPMLPPPQRVLDVDEPKQPILCPATAVEKDGAVHVRLTTVRQVPYTVVKKVAETVTRKVVVSGVSRTVSETVYRDVTESRIKSVTESSELVADGKTVKVTRKNGDAVNPKELPRLLEKETQVLLVTRGEIDPEFLREMDDRTLIIRIAPAIADPLLPMRKD